MIAGYPPLMFISSGDQAPGLSYPLISGIGAIRRPADGSESANVTIDLANQDGEVSRLFAVPPLRAPATLYGPDGQVWFQGWLTSVVLDDNASITLQA